MLYLTVIMLFGGQTHMGPRIMYYMVLGICAYLMNMIQQSTQVLASVVK